jgi:hypothetical protein
MDPDDYFRLVVRAMRQYASYSPERGAWVIPCLDAVAIIFQYQDDLPAGLNSFAEIFHAGEQRELWRVCPDAESGLKVVVLKQRSAINPSPKD